MGAILLLSLTLRLWGITWGLPNSLHYFSYHPDEAHILIASSPAFPEGLNLFAGKFLPSFYNWGSLQLYLINIALSIASTYGLIGPVASKAGGIDTTAWAHCFLLARLLTVAMSIGAVWVVYAIGRRLWGPSVGLVAALILAVMPLAAQHAHFATVDIPATFWIGLSLLWSVRGWQDEKKPLRAFMLAGLFAGLAAATKYNAALAILPIIAAGWLRSKAPTSVPSTTPASGYPRGGGEERNIPLLSKEGLGEVLPAAQTPPNLPLPRGGKDSATTPPHVIGGRMAESQEGGHLIGALLTAALAFLVACPGAVLDSRHFLADFRTEAVHISQQGEIYFQHTGLGWVYIVARNLDTGLGLPLLLLAIAGALWALWRRQPGDLLLAAFALPYYLVVGAAQSRYARYEIPLLPVLALWAARLVLDLAHAPGWRRPAAIAIGALVALFTLADTLVLLAPMSQPDPRDRAAVWLAKSAPAPAQIGFAQTPWFWSPPLDPYFTLPRPGKWREVAPASEAARFIYNPDTAFDPAQLSTDKPPFVVLSEYDYFDRLRLQDPDTLAYLAILRQDYRLAAAFGSTHPLGGRRQIDGLPIQDLPHDMLYPSPHILIFVRK